MAKIVRGGWVRCTPLCIVLAAALLIAGTAASTVPAQAVSGGGGFVTRQGGQLMLDGHPFRFSGPNLPFLARDGSGSPFVPYTYTTPYRTEDQLATAAYMGATVVRSQFLGMSQQGCSLCVDPSLGQFNETALQHIDFAIMMAHRYGLHLIITLTQCYGKFGECQDIFTNWLGVPQGDFYTNPEVIAAFEQYITHLLDHVNVYTGVALKDDPTIMAWETCNECTTSSAGEPAWSQQIAAFLKQLDPHHLVMDGNWGVDPATLSDPNIDLYSDHFYPMHVAKIESDGATVAAAGKLVVAGEYAWNMQGSGANGCIDCGDTLPAFLQALEQTPGVAGDTYYSLEGHNDAFGYEQHGAVGGFSLLYPGDTPAMRTAASELRAHAYAMTGVPVPAYPAPGTPQVTSVERVSGANLIEWRGAAGGASYTVQRSTVSPVGPWATICQACATDDDTPWPDTSGPAGPSVWYRVQANNPAGDPGAWSTPFQLRLATLDDPLDNWSETSSHSSDLALDSSSPDLFGGDTSRAAQTQASTDQIVWRVPAAQTFEVVAYFPPSAKQTNANKTELSLLVSADGQTWRSINDQVALQDPVYWVGAPTPSEWLQWTYTAQDLSGVSYVEVVWNNVTGQALAPEIGEVRITHAGSP